MLRAGKTNRRDLLASLCIVEAILLSCSKGLWSRKILRTPDHAAMDKDHGIRTFVVNDSVT
jgi:hypothetical protein